MVNPTSMAWLIVANDGRIVIARWHGLKADADSLALRQAFVDRIGRDRFHKVRKGRNSHISMVRWAGPLRRSRRAGAPQRRHRHAGGLVLMARSDHLATAVRPASAGARLDLDHASDGDTITGGGRR